MRNAKSASRRRFSDAAQAAALEGRRRKREAALPTDAPEVFIIRTPPTDLVFAWEIRRFGALVLQKSRVDYATTHEARTAGESALSTFRVES